VALAPEDPRVLHNYAVIEARREGGLANAVEVLLQALELDPAYDRARLTLADCLREAGRLEEAAEHLRHLAEGGGELAGDARELLQRLPRAD
jgi:Tfp pilus assembly protein PilF